MSDMNELRALVGVTNMLNARTKLEQAHPDDKAQFLRELGLQPQAVKVVMTSDAGEVIVGVHSQGVVLEKLSPGETWVLKSVAGDATILRLHAFGVGRIFIHPTVAD